MSNTKSFVESLLEEGNASTRYNFIKYVNLPKLLERTLIDYYVDDLEVKQIASKYNVDDRTVKRWKKAAIEKAAEHFKQFIVCHFNDTKPSL